MNTNSVRGMIETFDSISKAFDHILNNGSNDGNGSETTS